MESTAERNGRKKNCYEESNLNAEQPCAAPCHTVLVVHVAAANPTEMTASDAGVAMPALAIQCKEAFPCLTCHDVNSVKLLLLLRAECARGQHYRVLGSHPIQGRRTPLRPKYFSRKCGDFSLLQSPWICLYADNGQKIMWVFR